jgi:hypothetical protein
MAVAINQRRGSVNPPSQVLPNGGGSSTPSPIAIASASTYTTAGTNNKTLSGSQAIDGVTSAALFILVTDQTTASQNGYYQSDSGAWIKQDDQPSVIAVIGGTLNARTLFVNTATNVWKPMFGVLN